MEKRIKALYIITIIAILSFLGMQGYWLYGRYEYSLNDYERNLTEKIVKCVDDYNDIRNKTSGKKSVSIRKRDDGEIIVPSISLIQQYGETVKTIRTAKILTYNISAHELHGVEPGTPLTSEMREKTADLARKQTKVPADSVIFDLSGAKDETEAWTATKNVLIERKSPFTTDGIDSVLNKAGIKAQIITTRVDSIVWKNKVDLHPLALMPKLSVTIPYSQVEGKVVTIVCEISPFDVLPGMWESLIITLVISTLLIVCLVLQFSTVLKLSRLDKMRNSFVTTMIHELKRPISTLKICVSGLDNEKMLEDRETKQEILSETRNALDNLSAYFSKLRDITFNDVEQIPLNIQSINLHDLFADMVSATVLPADKSVKIHNDIDKNLEISADRAHLYNIFNNLVENAIKYSGTSVEINASASANSGFVEIRISDTGNGISSGDLKHIFKRFYRGKASTGEQLGMGLGLAYVKLLIDAHGGDITVASTEGEGSCFTIRLPQ